MSLLVPILLGSNSGGGGGGGGDITWVSVPATMTSTGTAGQLAKDSSYLYVCVSTDSWRRFALAEF